MKVYRWMHVATAVALLGALVGCDADDFDTEPEVVETQPAEPYEADPTTPATVESTEPAEDPYALPPTEELQQNSQTNPLGDPTRDDTLDTGDTLNSPSALDDSQTLETPRGVDSGGAPAPAEQSPLDQPSAEGGASEGDDVAEDVTEVEE